MPDIILSHDNYMRKEFYCLRKIRKQPQSGEATCPRPSESVLPASVLLCFNVNNVLVINKKDYFHVLELPL